MNKVQVTAKPDHIRSLAKAKPLDALAELIWNKILLWFIGSIATIIIGFIAFFYISKKISGRENSIINRPVVINGLNGVTIGVKVSDAQFRTGAKLKTEGDKDAYEFPSDPKKFFLPTSPDGLAVLAIGAQTKQLNTQICTILKQTEFFVETLAKQS